MLSAVPRTAIAQASKTHTHTCPAPTRPMLGLDVSGLGSTYVRATDTRVSYPAHREPVWCAPRTPNTVRVRECRQRVFNHTDTLYTHTPSAHTQLWEGCGEGDTSPRSRNRYWLGEWVWCESAERNWAQRGELYLHLIVNNRLLAVTHDDFDLSFSLVALKPPPLAPSGYYQLRFVLFWGVTRVATNAFAAIAKRSVCCAGQQPIAAR